GHGEHGHVLRCDKSAGSIGEVCTRVVYDCPQAPKLESVERVIHLSLGSEQKTFAHMSANISLAVWPMASRHRCPVSGECGHILERPERITRRRVSVAAPWARVLRQGPDCLSH